MSSCIKVQTTKGRSDDMKMTIVIGHAMIPTQTCCIYLYIHAFSSCFNYIFISGFIN